MLIILVVVIVALEIRDRIAVPIHDAMHYQVGISHLGGNSVRPLV